ncbi:hypothetical protein [Nitrosococcus watsonii]|uniref:Uncharacterized protein n=1 Tax=Nitrosococcus watsoni (strain C-113) TaxID=105559 RepID=D8K5L0_NITWC|nr:hypothetical protein [Nitrosococcus watsonii]ADJ28187.1 conserved hypothetical protein [Nitrosococcus watsonii C-113]
MSKLIQLRNVPNKLHRKLKARAAQEGMPLSDYLLARIQRASERPTLSELRKRLHGRIPVEPHVAPPAEAIRAERERQ